MKGLYLFANLNVWNQKENNELQPVNGKNKLGEAHISIVLLKLSLRVLFLGMQKISDAKKTAMPKMHTLNVNMLKFSLLYEDIAISLRQASDDEEIWHAVSRNEGEPCWSVV